MAIILAFIVSYMDFLWSGARFRIVHSEVSTSNGGDALLIVESARLRLRFVCDRRQLLLDLQPAFKAGVDEWFSIDLIRRLLMGTREESAILDESYAAFLKERVDEIGDRFSAENSPKTLLELRNLKRVRAKEMFG